MLSDEGEREQIGEERARLFASAANLLSLVDAEASVLGLDDRPPVLSGEANTRAQGLSDPPPPGDADLRITSPTDRVHRATRGMHL
jgi:hypothetical protein